VVDRRRGAERRSTRERRGRPTRPAAADAPSEHIRNALQLLRQLAAMREADDPESGAESANILAAAIQRARRALELLEARGPERP
jgi:hypothetical protein